uniref:Putative soluble epoxide hydrolase n=1 Tax=Ixodes ricinus TaxID=34613 RepID=A0A0K8RIK8_IXORI
MASRRRASTFTSCCPHCGRYSAGSCSWIFSDSVTATSPFHTYSIFEQANITEALVARLRLRRVHILAHDLGDTVAQELLARQNEGSLPFQINTVCLLNGGVLPKHHYPRWSQKLLRMPVVGVVASKLMNHLAFRLH